MSSYDWINDYIGIPYECNGRGPGVFDCYGLVIDIYKKQLGIDLPDWLVDDTAQSTAMRAITGAVAGVIDDGKARQVENGKYEDFNIVVLTRHQMAHHVGLYIAGGVLHTKQGGAGVIFEPFTAFEQQCRGKLEVFKWLG